LIEPLEDYLKEDDKRLIEAFEIISEDFKSYHQLIGPILATGLKENYEFFYPKIELLFNDQDERLRAISFQVLNNSKSNIKNGDHEKIKQIIVEKSQSEEDQVLATLIPLGFTLFCEFDEDIESFNKLLEDCIGNGSDITLNFLADFFAKHYSDLTIPTKNIVLSALEAINPEHKGTIQKVDRGINKLYQSGEKESACLLLDKILEENEGNISINNFSLTKSMLIRDRENILSFVITRWLYSGNSTLCINANKLISKISEEYAISLDLSQIDVSSEKQVLYLSRKIIGYLSYMPDKIIHLLFSMVKEITDLKVLNSIQQDFFEVIFINFPGDTKKVIKKYSEDDDLSDFANGLIKMHETYNERLKSVETIKELWPSLSQREAYRRNFNQKYHESLKQAEKQSVLSNIVHKSVIMNGSASVSYTEIDGEPQRHFMRLGKMEHSFEQPRMPSIAPFDFIYSINQFRLEEKP